MHSAHGPFFYRRPRQLGLIGVKIGSCQPPFVPIKIGPYIRLLILSAIKKSDRVRQLQSDKQLE